MANFDDLEVGDKVAAPLGIDPEAVIARTVTRILKRFIELSDGSKWDHNGHPYPHQRYSTRFIRPMTEELEAKIHRQRALRYIGKANLASLTTGTISAIVGLIKDELGSELNSKGESK